MKDDNELNDTESTLAISQTELFDHIRTICELEDQKQAIQTDINERTVLLKSALGKMERDGLLYQMLAAALRPAGSAPSRPKRSTKVAARRKRS